MKKNGERKEYYKNGKLKFEGNYLYDRILNGIAYNYNGDEFYEIKNGSGKIKEYNFYGLIEFEGSYYEGKRSGKGKEYINGKLYYESEFLRKKKWICKRI